MTERYRLNRFGYPVPVEPKHSSGRDADGLSYGQRVTIRNRKAIEAGRHPITGAALLGGDTTCRECGYAYRAPRGARSLWKCELNDTRSVVTDLRVSWPACTYFVVRRIGASGEGS